jgi:hypothetical protein
MTLAPEHALMPGVEHSSMQSVAQVPPEQV